MTATPIRTAAKDQNLLSLNSSSVVWYAGTDREVVAPEGIPYPCDLFPEDPKMWDTILKLSGRTNTTVANLRIAQGKEAAVDINNTSSGILLEGRFGMTGREGEHVVKIKGGSYDITLKGTLESSGLKADIVIGEWSDQSSAPVHHVDLSLLRHSTGRPLTLVIARVTNPIRTILFGKSPDIALPPGARIKVLASLAELAYWWCKRLYVAAWYHRW